MRNSHISPIMISGIHRSGTSMVTNILSRMGLVIGNKLDANYESLFFQRINIWMMTLLSSSWDSPKRFDSIDNEVKQNIVLQINKLLNSRTNSIYLGWSSIISRGSFRKINNPWGWKDPRNVFTEPMWKEVFPDLKTVYIVRHPIDIADSLLKRQDREKNIDIKREKEYADLVKSLLSIAHTSYNSSLLINSHEDCFNLIELYYDQILNNLNDNSLLVKFEDILSNPDCEIKNILAHCDIPLNKKKLEDVIKDINFSKSYAYRKNSDLIKFESKHRSLIDKMEY